jgi:hypothetical protein
VLVSIQETDYRRLLLQLQMNASVVREAGLNHLEYRGYRSYYSSTVTAR